MIRTFICLIFLMVGLSAQAAEPIMEYVLNDESKPPGERSVAVVVALHGLKALSSVDPAIEKLGNDAKTLALTLKQHGGHDTVVLVEDEAVSRNNIMNVLRYFTEADAPPEYLHLHWAGPALDDITLATYGYNPENQYNDGAGIDTSVIGLALYPMKGAGHVVITFDAPPAPAPLARPEANQFGAMAWSYGYSAALSPGPGCITFTAALTTAINEAYGRRLSIKDTAAAVTRICGSPPTVNNPVEVRQLDDPSSASVSLDSVASSRLPDSATFIPLGDVREVVPAPLPLLAPLPEPVAPLPVPDPEPTSASKRPAPRGVRYTLIGTSVLLAGATSYELIKLNDALRVRNTTLDVEEYAAATKQANLSSIGAGVLGTLAVGSTIGLVIAF